MEIPTRQDLERRLSAIVADFLDNLEETNKDGYDLGVVAFAWEILTPDPEVTTLRREEGGYSPALDVDTSWAYYCSDHRWWIKEAIFREAHDYYAYPPSVDDTSDDDEA